MTATPPPETCPRCKSSTSEPNQSCDHPFHRAPLNTTPCPDWCTDNHWFHDDHRAVLARQRSGSGDVFLDEWLHNYGHRETELKIGMHAGYKTAWLEPRQARDLADVLNAAKGPAWMVRGLRAAAELAEQIEAGQRLERAS